MTQEVFVVSYSTYNAARDAFLERVSKKVLEAFKAEFAARVALPNELSERIDRLELDQAAAKSIELTFELMAQTVNLDGIGANKAEFDRLKFVGAAIGTWLGDVPASTSNAQPE